MDKETEALEIKDGKVTIKDGNLELISEDGTPSGTKLLYKGNSVKGVIKFEYVCDAENGDKLNKAVLTVYPNHLDFGV